MKKIFLLSVSVLLVSCSFKGTPECSDDDVKKVALEILNENLKKEIIEQYVRENFKGSFVISGGELKEGPSDDVERKRVEKEGEAYASKLLSKSTVVNIRSNNIDKEIKKCSCSADIDNGDLNKVKIEYTAQYPEDADDKVYVELSYTVD